MYRFFVAGNDGRAKAIRRALTEDGFDVCSLDSANVIIIPPGEKLEYSGEAAVFAPYGKNGFVNYLEQPEFKQKNAVPTAEGAISVAIMNTEKTLCNMAVAVIGNGAIASALLPRLSALGANVRVYARRGEGVLPISDIANSAPELIFNTVPAQVLGAHVLESLATKPLIIDLASRPGGVDFEAARALGITALHELSVPARTAPISAGEIVKDTVIKLLRGVK